MTSRDFTLIFPHIPKTGGTTLFNHFSRALGRDQVFVVGRHNRTRRFFGNRAQFEWAAPEEIARTNVFQGHGVNQSLLPWVDAGRTKLIVVLRNPIARTKSAFNQQLRRTEGQGGVLATEAFLNKDWDNMMSRLLVKWFPDFVPDETAPLYRQACDVLRSFDYVLTTEAMDRRLPPLLDWLGLPTEIERRRVAGAKRDLDVGDDVLEARNKDDMALFQACSAGTDTNGEIFNPLGFDPAARQAALDRVRQSARTSQTPEQRVQFAYEELAKGLCSELLAEAAFAKLDQEGAAVNLPDPQAFRLVLEKAWADKEPNLTPAQSALSQKKLRRRMARLENRKRTVRPEKTAAR